MTSEQMIKKYLKKGGHVTKGKDSNKPSDRTIQKIGLSHR